MINDKGITLIEMIITLALIGLAVLLVITMMLWGSKSFYSAGAQSVLHKELREEANFITKQIRDSAEIEIVSEIDPDNLSDEYNYIYLEDGKIKKITVVDNDAYAPTNLEVEITKLNFSISNNNLVRFSITGSYKGKEYTIDSSVVAEKTLEELGLGEGSAIRYRMIEEVRPTL